MSKIINQSIDAMLLNVGLSVSVIGKGEQVRDNDWKCDAWRFTITNAQRKSESFDYYTGIGHRKCNLAPALRPKFVNPNCIAAEEFNKRHVLPVAPHVAGLLHSLVLDGSALEQCFIDWCADFGYDADSMKALTLYNACCENARRLQLLIGRELFAKISEALQDY